MGAQATAVREAATPADSERFVSINVLITSRQREAFRQIARRRQLAAGAVIREVLREYLESLADAT